MGFTTIRILGQLLMLLSLMMIPPILVEIFYQDGHALIFHLAFVLTFVLGFLLWFTCKTARNPIRLTDGFIIMCLFWLTASAVSAVPLYLAPIPNLSFTNAFFEAVSGFSTTGSTILTNIEILPHSILYYRQQLQFVGGFCVIILAITLVPALGIGGFSLFRKEIASKENDKLTPRFLLAAKEYGLIYLGLITGCAICYKLAGMDWFDAMTHSFSTVSTGGFSTHDASMGYFTNFHVKLTAMIFMLLGAFNFSLHFLVFKSRRPDLYARDPELRFFFKIIVGAILLIWLSVLIAKSPHYTHHFIEIVFHSISFATTTGFELGDLSLWPAFVPILLLLLGVIGGCAGSASGGFKVTRIRILQKSAQIEIQKLIHPHGQFTVKLDNKILPSSIIESVLIYFVIYFSVFLGILLLLLLTELDFYTACSALTGAISNTGRGLGSVVDRFTSLTDSAKWILSFAMLAGRCEILTLCVVFSPAFWQR